MGRSWGLDASETALPPEHMEVAEAHSVKRGAEGSEGPESPARKQRAQHVLVDLAALKALMAEQSETLLQQTRRGMQDMVQELRAEITKGDAEVKQTLVEQGEKIRELVDHKDDVLRRLSALEAKGTGSVGSTRSGSEVPSFDRDNVPLSSGGGTEKPQKNR